MTIDGWKYYNYAIIPTTAPHETPNMHPVENGDIWKIDGGTPLLARWTTEFDCGYETNWWYVIKDAPFDLSSLKSNYRYKINKGTRMFDIHIINPKDYRNELYQVQVAAFSAYPKKYRPVVVKDEFIRSIDNWDKYVVFGAFFRETNELCGYSFLKINQKHVDLTVLKTNPQYEKYQINAALVEGILTHFEEHLNNGGYICDGTRNISHETTFQDYLEKYFGFRKAYCKLHILYKPIIGLIVKVIYPFRKLLVKFSSISIIQKISALLQMEEINRSTSSGS